MQSASFLGPYRKRSVVTEKLICCRLMQSASFQTPTSLFVFVSSPTFSSGLSTPAITMAEGDCIVLEARMHSESCRYKVYKAVAGYPGVEDINIDMKGQKVTLTGKVDAKKLFQKVKKRSGNKITKLIHYPELKEEKKKEDEEVIVVLKVDMYCATCTKKAKKIAWTCIGDVHNVEVKGDKMTITGKGLDPKKVYKEMIKRYGKHVELVPPEKEENKIIQTKVEYVCVYPVPQCFSDENPNALCAIM